MEPNQDPLATDLNQQATSRRPLIISAVIGAFFLLIIIIIGALGSKHSPMLSGPFRLVSTNPALSSVTQITPFIKATFSEPLTSNVTISDPSKIVKSTNVSGDVLTMSLDSPLKLNSSYNITVTSIESTTGDTLSNLQFNFKAGPLPNGPLPSDQVQAITQQQAQAQAQAPYSQSQMVFTGTQPLLDNGASSAQISNMEYAFFQYAEKTNQKIYTVDVEGVADVPHDPNSTSTTFAQTFTASFNGNNPYNARIDYHDLTYCRLRIYDPTSGNVIYDSGDVNVYSE